MVSLYHGALESFRLFSEATVRICGHQQYVMRKIIPKFEQSVLFSLKSPVSSLYYNFCRPGCKDGRKNCVERKRSHPRTCAITRSINQPTNLARRLFVPVSPLLCTEELIIFSFDFSLVQCYFGTCAIFRAPK